VSKIESRTVSIVGLGKVGLTLAAIWLNNGHKVIGLERDSQRVEAILSDGYCDPEPNVSNAIRDNRDKFFVNDYELAVRESDYFMCIVPTPSNPEDGAFSSNYVYEAWKELCIGVQKHEEDRRTRLFVIKSTLNPGDSRKLHKQISERFVNQSWELVYNPEFIALGEVWKGMKQPQLVLYGHEKSSNLVASYIDNCREIWSSQPKVHELELAGAEIAKIATNTFITAKISFANLLGQLSRSHKVVDPAVVLAAVGDDPRIGRAYLRPGLGYGGPCFPRDNKALARALEVAGLPRKLPDAIDDINDVSTSLLKNQVLHALEAKIEKAGRILFLGISYKPGTPVVEESKALALARALATDGYSVEVIDPMADILGSGFDEGQANKIDNLYYSAVVSAVGWSQFGAIESRAEELGLPVIRLG
jgi:UDPglucose 6-dehydrogenase